EEGVQLVQQTSGMTCVFRVTGDGNLEHRCDERRGHAVAGNVGDEDSYASIVDGHELVEIAGDLRGWSVDRGEVESTNRRRRLRKDRHLNLTRGGKLAVDRRHAHLRADGMG